MLRSRHETLTTETSSEGPNELAIEALVQGAGFAIDVRTISEQPMKSRCKLRVHYTVLRQRDRPRELLEQISSLPGVACVEWDDSNLP
ncbi:MAG: hypothetical protein JO172_09570 [Hyphomicrobiales bacterium]|nr:hypothetical protein [Hyphomicrobiales bacterium]